MCVCVWYFYYIYILAKCLYIILLQFSNYPIHISSCLCSCSPYVMACLMCSVCLISLTFSSVQSALITGLSRSLCVCVCYSLCLCHECYMLSFTDLSSLTLEDIDSVSEAERVRDRDTLGPLPPPAWTNQYSTNPYGPSYMPPPPPPVNMNYPPPAPFYDTASYVSVPMANNSAGSIQSGSGKCWRQEVCW